MSLPVAVPARPTLRPPTALVCAGCGYRSPREALPLSCPRAGLGDDVDHVMRRTLEARRLEWPCEDEANPFVRYRTLLHGYQRALTAGLSDDYVVDLIRRLDAAIAQVDGRGFTVTPFAPSDALAGSIGIYPPASVWVKDETANVSGSHKARHLFGVMIELLLADVEATRPMAIASCGNAALAAAVVARAAERELHVFVPTDADAGVLARLSELGAQVAVCPRRAGQSGDPTVIRLREAVANGAVPFTCQGNENGLAIEGGLTLGYEIADALRLSGTRLDHVVVQVGGGALASSVIQGLQEANALGAIDSLPRIHTVQTRNVHPLARAYERVMVRLHERLGGPLEGAVERLSHAASSGSIDGELEWIGNHRAQFMWPWESAPGSVATGILDDETYDWLAVVRGMLATGGGPVVVDEHELVEANALARAATGIDVDPTGSAGLAGLIRLYRSGAVQPRETCAVLFTGVRRNGGTP